MSRERGVLALGLVLLAVGVSTLPWVVTGLWADPGFLETWERRVLFRIVSLAGLLVGGTLVVARAAIAARLVPLLAAAVTVLVVLSLFLATDLFLGYRMMSPERVGEELEQLHDPDPRLGWVPRPGAAARHRLDGNFDIRYRIDAEGFREIPYAGTPARRFWIFGDSYTFGFGVENEEAWPAVLARELRPQDRVINLAVNGYGLIQMYGRLQDVAPRIEPGDVVVFAPTAGDWQRNVHDFQHVSLLLFGSGAQDLHFPSFQDGELVGVRIDTPWRRVRALFLHAMISEGVFRFVNRAVTAPASIEEGHAVLAATRELAAAQAAEFILMVLPKVKEIRRDRYEVDLGSFRYHDLRPYFPQDPEALEELRFPMNAHWNREGHAVAAAAVFQVLRDAGLTR